MLPADITVVHTSDQYREYLDWLRTRAGQYIALDTETSDTDLLYDPRFRIRLIQIGDTRTAWVFPWHMWGGAVATSVQEYDGRILIHNADYDMTVLNRAGFPLDWSRVIDTMLAMRIAESDERSGLKEAANRHLDPDADLSQKDLKAAMTRNGWTWDTIPLLLPIFTTYAGWDVILTSRLYELPIVQDAIASDPWQLEMDTARVCAKMSENGMRVDLDMCEAQRTIMRDEAAVARDHIVDAHGLNVGSNPEVARWFLTQSESRELMTKKTKGGAISVDVEVLEKIIANALGTEPADVATAILGIRRREKLASSYFDTFIERADQDGLVHASILPSEAKTGRMQIRNPALQTLPKDGAAGVRNVVLPRRDGEWLITADYDQIEMRLAAVFSRDAGLIETFEQADLTGLDFFTSMGRQIYHDLAMQKSDPRRGKIKNTMYGTAYGAGPNKIAVTAKISALEARGVRDDLFKAYPGLPALMRNIERSAKRNGYVTTLGGRRLTVPPMLAYKGLNALIQGSAAILFKRALVELACAGLDDYLVVPVHDEVVLSVPTDEVEDVRRLVAEIMPIRDLSLLIGASPSPPLARWGDDKK